MVTVVVRIPQAGVGLVHAARVVAQLGARVRVALAGLHTLPAAWLVLVIGVVLLVLDTQPLRLLHKGALLTLTQQAAGQRQGWDEQAAGTTSVSLGGPGELCACPRLRGGRGPRPCCLAAQTKRWAEGLRVPAPLAGRGSTTARGILRLCPASACQTGLPWSSPPA